MSVRTKRGLGLDKYIREGELGIDYSQFSIFHTNSNDLEGQPSYNSNRSSEPSTNDLQTCDSSVECSRPNHSDCDSTDYISSVFAPASESGDTIVIDCDKQEDFPSICSIETDVKSSKPLFAKRNAKGKGKLERRPTGKQVNPNRPKPVSAGQLNPVSAGQPNLVSAGQPNPVYAGQPNPVSAGDGILGPRPLNIQTKSWPWTQYGMAKTKGSKINGGSKSKSWSYTKGLLGRPKLEKAKDKGIVDSGCSRSMSGNKDKLEDFEYFNGGEVTFGGSTGKILGKGTIKTKNLNFENVLYVEELQHFNLIFVSQICDYLNELAPKGPLTCLIAKALQNESTLWHRRLGHVNFRNMNKLGIRRDYSNARTSKQNRVAERKNRTLIEAARTMLVDSLLPTIFWSEAVATACYVLNKVLVTKPHPKTPYELLTGDKPSISYLKPSGCHVTILNTSDPLGKFDKKSDEGYIVGVSSTNLTIGSQGATPSNAGFHEDDLDSDDEPYVLIIHSTLTLVVPIVNEATTQNDGKEEADKLGLAFPSLFLILGVGSTPIGSSVSASSTPPVSAGSTPLMSPCASPISAGRPVSAGTPTGFAGRPVFTSRPVSAGKSTGSAVRCVSAGRPSGSASRTPIPAGRILGNLPSNTPSERFPQASSVENLDIHNRLKIFDCPKSGIFTSSSYDEEFSGPDANNLRRNNHPDFQLCMFSCFLSQEEPTTVAQALADPDRIAEEVYVTQPRGFEDLNHPKKVYKVVKALYDLHQAPRACDYAGAHGDRKSTTSGCQFLRRRLIFWQCKKQTIVATSSCEAEYVAAASCCG
nr:ribonuclease H-like domain-containing protein [Tanacetum cinerariifolium]